MIRWRSKILLLATVASLVLVVLAWRQFRHASCLEGMQSAAPVTSVVTSQPRLLRVQDDEEPAEPPAPDVQQNDQPCRVAFENAQMQLTASLVVLVLLVAASAWSVAADRRRWRRRHRRRRVASGTV